MARLSDLLRTLPMKRQLQGIIMLTVATALFVASSALLAHGVVTWRASMQSHLRLLAGMIAVNSTAAISFDDRSSATEILAGLREQPAVIGAALYTAERGTFATYLRHGATPRDLPSAPLPDRCVFLKDRLIVFRTVVLGGQPIGTAFLASDLSEFHSSVVESVRIISLVFAVSGIIAFLMGSQLQNLVSGPIVHLVQTAKAVTMVRNYAIRATENTGGELGQLIDGFNEMLGEIQQRDAELHRHRDSLEEEVYARTAELRAVNSELIESRDLAREGSRAKSEFLANMSHEIRTPMNGILGMTELALETSLTDDQRDQLKTVKSSAESLLSILNDILDLSKIEAGKLELELIAFQPHECVRQAVALLDAQARQKGIALDCEFGSGVPEWVFGDPTRLRQVLINLLGNAVKFTSSGRVWVEVVGEPAPDPAPDGEVTLTFAVSDTGIGIASANLDHIFEAFSQADGSMTRRFGGTGLGLTICSRLVTLMGGRIAVESRPGKGSKFHFTARVQPALQPDLAALESSVRSPEDPIRKLNLLVAEDNSVNQKVIRRILEKHGHCITIAGSGREALAFFHSASFDLILMDVQMPEMDGLSAATAIRRSELGTGRHTPIVAMTAHAMMGDRERCLASGMDDYVSKPIHAQHLLEKLQQYAAQTANLLA
jgi:signal transduction histidine kinase/ActR/RegA family two-component response regulator